MNSSVPQYTGLMRWLLFCFCYLFSTPASALTCASGWVALQGSYYNNKNASGTVAATRADTNINFNWVAAAPGVGGLGADAWSVRWDGTLRAIKTGNYRFRTITDDGVRLYVNGVQIINDWNSHVATTNTSTDVYLVAGRKYTVQMDYFDDAFDASAVLSWLQPGATEYALIPSVIGSPDTSATCTCSDALVGGAVGNYYNNNNLTGSATNSRLDTLLDFNWGTGAPGPTGVGSNNFSVRWNGNFRPSTTGTYTFQTTSDDGVRLSLNGNSLISSWQANNNITYTSSGVNLSAGVSYPLVLDFYDGIDGAAIRLQWKLNSGSYTSMTSCPASEVDHYGIVLTSPGFTCSASAIVISAYDSANTLVAPASGTTLTLSTSTGTGTWVGGDTVVFNGSASSVTKYLQHASAVANLNINVSDGLATESAALDPNISFDATGLAIYGTSAAVSAIANQVAGVADNNPILKVTNCATRVSASSAPAVSFAYECRNPTSCISGESLTVNGVAAKANNNGASIAYNSSAQSLSFSSAGAANIPIQYSDVGQVKLHASMTFPATGNDPAVTLTANSGDFVVKPHTLHASVQTASSAASANPGGTSSAGSSAMFVSAGTPFQVKIESRRADGGLTPNFGNETPSQNNLQFVATGLTYPASGGTLTGLTNASAFSATTPAGTFVNTTIYWDQVGSFTARPELADNDYLGAGDIANKILAGPASIGRFYPDHFTLVSSSTANSCGSFSYLQQPFSFNYVLQAQSANNTVVSNYGSTIYNTAAVAYVAENANSGDGATYSGRLLDGVFSPAPVWSNGAITVSGSTAYLARKLPLQVPDGPFASLKWGVTVSDSFDGSRALKDLDMNALTSDNCTLGCNAKAIGSALSFRYGRLRLDPASGPETAALPVNFVTEYWTGTYFALNILDSCTRVPHSAITYPSGTLDNPAHFSIGLSLGTTQGVYGGVNPTAVPFTLGIAPHYFTKPSAGGVGSFVVGIDLSSLTWLRYDWNQDGNYSDASIANVPYNFGRYRGNNRVIYWRERFQ